MPLQEGPRALEVFGALAAQSMEQTIRQPTPLPAWAVETQGMAVPAEKSQHPFLLALGAGTFLLGVSAGAALGPGPDTAPFLAGVTGAVLLLAFRVYERRAAAQEDRITGLEERRAALEAANERLEQLQDSIARAAAATLADVPTADDDRGGVASLAGALGRELGLDEDALVGLRTAALLHDIGRMTVPMEVWERPGRLTAEDWEQVKAHPEQAARWLAPIAFPWPVVETVRAQGERWDGSGYPDRLRGADIPLWGRILAVADAYHAMRSDRAHRPAMTHRAAIEALQREAGGRFDPHVVAAFTRMAADAAFLNVLLAVAPKSENPTTVRLSGAGADERI